MRIKELRIQNFRSHQDTRLGLDRLNLFVGPNGSGKTTIKAAIEFLLTGKCGWTDARGSGKEELIRHGAKKALVSALIEYTDGNGQKKEIQASRGIPGGLQVTGWTGNSTAQQQALYQELGAGERTITALLNTHNFLLMPPGEQKNMVFALLGLEMDLATVEGHLAKAVSPAALAEYKTHAKSAPPLRGLVGGGEVFDKLDAHFREARRVTKQGLAGAKAMAGAKPPEPPPYLVENPGQTVASALEGKRAALSELEEYTKNKVLRPLAAAESRAEQVTAIEDRLAKLKRTAVSPAQEVPSKEECDALEAQVTETESAVVAAHSGRNQVEREMATIDGQLALLRGKDTIECPILPGAGCPHDPDRLRKSLAAQKGNLTKRLNGLPEPPVGELAVRKDRLQEAREKRLTADINAKAAADLVALTGNAERELEQARFASAQLPDLMREAAVLDKELGRLKDLIRGLEEYQAGRGAMDRLEESADRLEKQVAALEELVVAFGPKGIKADLLTGTIRRLQDHAEGRTAELTRGRYRMELEASGETFQVFLIQNPDGERVSAKNLSGGEQDLAGIVLQDILNTALATDAGLLVIDEAQRLDVENRTQLIHTLLGMEEYGTIIVLAARGETPPRDPGLGGLAVFEIDGGMVTRAPGTPGP